MAFSLAADDEKEGKLKIYLKNEEIVLQMKNLNHFFSLSSSVSNR